MLSKQDMSKRAQIGFFSLEDLVPQDHLLRQIDQWVLLRSLKIKRALSELQIS